MIDRTVIRGIIVLLEQGGSLKKRVSRQKSICAPTPEGLPIATEISGGEVSDYKRYVPLMEACSPEPKVLLADRGYD